jgi:hypothetical protein
MGPMAFPPATPGASPLGLTGVVGGVNAEAGLSTVGTLPQRLHFEFSYLHRTLPKVAY